MSGTYVAHASKMSLGTPIGSMPAARTTGERHLDDAAAAVEGREPERGSGRAVDLHDRGADGARDVGGSAVITEEGRATGDHFCEFGQSRFAAEVYDTGSRLRYAFCDPPFKGTPQQDDLHPALQKAFRDRGESPREPALGRPDRTGGDGDPRCGGAAEPRFHRFRAAQGTGHGERVPGRRTAERREQQPLAFDGVAVP